MTISRRQLLIAVPLTLAATQAKPLPLLEEDLSFAQLLRHIGGQPYVSQILIDAAEAEYSLTYGEQRKAKLVRLFSRGAMNGRLANLPPEIIEEVRFLARFLYTGEVESNGKRIAAYYPWSLGWAALTFASAPGLCGGDAFGHWSKPPQPEGM